jgi:NADH dehydrogenase
MYACLWDAVLTINAKGGLTGKHMSVGVSLPSDEFRPLSDMADLQAARRVVLVGCSFAGLEFLYRYVRRRGRPSPGELTVVEPRSHHPYVPLAHEATSGASTPDSLRFDLGAFCASIGAGVVRGAAAGLDAHAGLLHLDGGATVPYDRLVIALGSEPAVPVALSTCGVVPAKWLSDALSLRERIRVAHASTGTPARVTVVGAGITGVEWAAELGASEIAGIRPAVAIVAREARVLADFAPGIASHASRVLGGIGVRCILQRSVTDVDDESVVLDDGERVASDVVVWAGGVRPNRLVHRLGLPLTASGHVAVTPRLAVPDAAGVYAIGDAVRIVEGGSPWPTMERAIEAIWQGALLGRRMAARQGDGVGSAHRLRRHFFYGLSLGPRHSLVLYRALWIDARLFVHFRRWLKWAYYARFTLLARWSANRARR